MRRAPPPLPFRCSSVLLLLLLLLLASSPWSASGRPAPGASPVADHIRAAAAGAANGTASFAPAAPAPPPVGKRLV